MARHATLEASEQQGLSMALATLDLNACEQNLLTRTVVLGTATITPVRGSHWSRHELADAADQLATQGLVGRAGAGQTVSLSADLTEAVATAARKQQGREEQVLAPKRVALWTRIMSRLQSTPHVLGASGDHEAEYQALLRRTRLSVTAVPIVPLGSPASRTKEYTRRMVEGPQHPADAREIDVVAAGRVRDPVESAYAAALERRGCCSVSVAPEVPLRLTLLDGGTAVVPLDPHNHALGAMVIDDPDAVAQVGLQLATQLAAARRWVRREAPPLTTPEHVVLRLLGEGLTDEAVARRMSICDRGVRRLVGDLKTKFGVSSRFELAVVAARLGLL